MREIGKRVDKRENEGESKADNSMKLRTGRLAAATSCGQLITLYNRRQLFIDRRPVN